MFSGSYSHSIDNKGRTVIPSKFRSKLGERFYMTRGMSGCLWIFGEEEWRDFKSKLTPSTPLDRTRLDLERLFVGFAVECNADPQGRVFIPQNLRDLAGITDEIWVVGVGRKVEVWSKERWDDFSKRYTDEKIEALGASLHVELV